jgi:hypothetical protein
MRYEGLQAFLDRGGHHLAAGPVALIFIEDAVEMDSTLRHALGLGFAATVAFLPEGLDLPPERAAQVVQVRLPTRAEGAVTDAVNRVIEAAPGVWLHYAFGAEYLFYPFCETRTVRELLAFHAEERREAMLTYVVDLYPGDLERAPDGVSLTDAHLDRIGYFAQARPDPATGHPGAAAGFLRRHALALRAAHPPGQPSHRPHRAVPRPPRAAAAGGSPAQRRGDEHLRLPLAPQPDGGHRLVPHRQGAEGQPRLDA